MQIKKLSMVEVPSYIEKRKVGESSTNVLKAGKKR